MLPVPRRLLNTASAISLLLCLATAVLWVRSKEGIGADQIRFSVVGRFWIVTSSQGQLYVETVPNWAHDAKASMADWAYLSWFFKAKQTIWGYNDFHGFCLLRGGACAELYAPQIAFSSEHPVDSSGPTSAWKAGAPHWFILIAVSVPLMLFLVKRLTAYLNVPPGHCPMCHYNLTGNTSGICPECGTAVPNKVGATA